MHLTEPPRPAECITRKMDRYRDEYSGNSIKQKHDKCDQYLKATFYILRDIETVKIFNIIIRFAGTAKICHSDANIVGLVYVYNSIIHFIWSEGSWQLR